MARAPAIYLDHNAATPVSPAAQSAWERCVCGPWGHPAAAHRGGQRLRRWLAWARREVAALLGAPEGTVLFAPSGAAANFLALRLALARLPRPVAVLTSPVEHPSVLAALAAHRREGVEIRFLPVDRTGRVQLRGLSAALDARVGLISLQWANNETGVLQPLAAVAREAARRGVLVHTDAAQAVGKHPVNVARVPVHFLSLSGPKLGAPPGVGAVWVRARGLAAPPEEVSVPAAAALGAAARERRMAFTRVVRRLRRLRDLFEAELQRLLPAARIHGLGAQRLPNTSSVAFPGVDGRELLRALDRHGLRASRGPACRSRSPTPSPVLLAMGLSAPEANATLRFSFGPTNRPAEARRAARLTASWARALGAGAPCADASRRP